MKSPSSRSPLHRIPSVQTPPERTAGPTTSVTAARDDVALRNCAKCTDQVALSAWSVPVDSSHAKSTTPPLPRTIVEKTTAPLPAFTLRIGDHVPPLSVETA